MSWIANHTINSLNTITILLFSCLVLNAQNCIEYPVIDGDPCGQCAPEGWEVVSDTPDILNPVNSFCNPEPSPTGGNVIHLWSNGVDHFEAVSSSFEIPNFIDGQEYYFGIYYSGCGSHPYTLSITINGEVYDFTPEASWEYFEICGIGELNFLGSRSDMGSGSHWHDKIFSNTNLLDIFY